MEDSRGAHNYYKGNEFFSEVKSPLLYASLYPDRYNQLFIRLICVLI